MKKGIYVIVALLLAVLCFFSILIRKNKVKKIEEEAINQIESITEISDNDNSNSSKKNYEEQVWFLVIPSLGVKAQIKEGVDQEILKYWIRTFRRNKHMEAGM